MASREDNRKERKLEISVLFVFVRERKINNNQIFRQIMGKECIVRRVRFIEDQEILIALFVIAVFKALTIIVLLSIIA